MTIKTFKDTLLEEGVITEAATYGEIADKRKFDAADPEVRVVGTGIWKMSRLKSNIIAKLEDMVKMANANEYERLLFVLSPKGILTHLVNAVVETERELDTPNIKRKITLQQKAKDQKVEERKKLTEDAPRDPKIALWIKQNRAAYIKKFGEKEGLKRLYREAWQQFNAKKGLK